ncbi:MAG: hypothetical protein NVS1B11_36320 [Terriglobales bacterium]
MSDKLYSCTGCQMAFTNEADGKVHLGDAHATDHTVILMPENLVNSTYLRMKMAMEAALKSK